MGGRTIPAYDDEQFADIEDIPEGRVYYLSGPMRGIEGHNYETFCKVEAALNEDVTGVILNPARNFSGDLTKSVSEYMTEDLFQVLDCDTVVLLPGWEKSEGARHEVAVARWVEKDFLYAVEAGNGYLFVHGDLPEPDSKPSPRASALNEARDLITGDRNNQYGPPTQDFTRTADMATAFGFTVNGQPVAAHHVALFVMLVKISRLAWTPEKRDSWVDIAGYAGCGYECAIERAERP